MSTAILISGQMRTFAQCYPTQRWHILRHFPDCHFFLCVQDNDDVWSIDLLRKEYGTDRVHARVIGDPVLEITPAIEAAYNFAPYANAAPAHQLLLQHWYQNEVWKFHQSHSSHQSHQFETIIRLRPDQFFHSFDLPREKDFWFLQPPPHAKLYGETSNIAFTPWWGRFGGINDRLAILGRDAARAYFTVYERIPELLAEYHCPFHPESLVKAALETAGCTIHETLRTEFTTLRADGNHRPPEIMPWDIAHAALTRAA